MDQVTTCEETEECESVCTVQWEHRLMLCSVTNISGSKFILLFDCKGKYWYKWLPSHRCDWIKVKRD